MYDYDLHMRFVRSATDAWFNYATAGWAAFGAWQNHVVNEVQGNAKPAVRQQAAPANAFSWWMDMFTPRPPAAVAPRADFGAPFFQFAAFQPSMPAAFDPMAMFAPMSMFNGMNLFSPMTAYNAVTTKNAFSPFTAADSWTAGWMEMMQTFSRGWPQMSWSMYQAPMTAWLMAQGLPYEVAAPTARGNAASMDAADAAREGFNRVYSSFRTDGGHAAAPAVTSMALMFAPFWDMMGVSQLVA